MIFQNLFHDGHIVMQTNHTHVQSVLYINSKNLRK